MKFKTNIIPRRGSILLYSVYLTMLMFVMVSLAVDYGRIQMIKTEEQRCADATARGILAACLSRYSSAGYSTPTAMARVYGPTIATMLSSKNPVDVASGISPTVTTTIGSWNTATKTFTADNGAAGPLAIKVIVGRTTSGSNPIHLLFPIPNGQNLVSKTIDVWAQSIVLLPNAITLNETVQSTYDPWLSGMPAGSTASYDDTAPGQSPVALTVIPGATLTVNSAISGSVSHGAGTPNTADGDTTQIYFHMKDPPTGAVASGQGAENYIGDIITPINSLIGVFLDGNQPSAANAPATVRDYTSQTARDDPDFTNLQVQQPFYIGNGINTSGATATFVVPSTATRFYMGPMDGFEWKNNTGSFTTSFNEQPPIQIVQ